MAQPTKFIVLVELEAENREEARQAIRVRITGTTRKVSNIYAFTEAEFIARCFWVTIAGVIGIFFRASTAGAGRPSKTEIISNPEVIITKQLPPAEH